MAHLKTQEELDELEFAQDIDWSWPPKKKFKPIPVRDLEDISFSSFRTLESDEEPEDTSSGPRKKLAAKNPHASSSAKKWNSSWGVSPQFVPFRHLMTKGEKSELVFTRENFWGL